MVRSFLLLAMLTTVAAHVSAKVPFGGWFIADKQCEAYLSKNKRTNPKDVRIEKHTAYKLTGINKKGGDWYHIEVPEAPVTQHRWVYKDCGVHVIPANRFTSTLPAAIPQSHGNTQENTNSTYGREATDFMLALSWQPAFCEKKTEKTECKQLNAGRLPITQTQLSLHGLWPQPKGNFYCGVSDAVKRLDKQKRWSELPAPALDADTTKRLATAMPGTASYLDRHEWIKHGTCFFGKRNGDEYFDDSLRTLDAVNRSSVGQLLAANVGSNLETSAIRDEFDMAFGQGAGERVQVKCTQDQGRTLIQELRISLKGKITETSSVGTLIRAGDKQSEGCTGGMVDAAGLQ